jgi:hypothetical protein
VWEMGDGAGVEDGEEGVSADGGMVSVPDRRPVDVGKGVSWSLGRVRHGGSREGTRIGCGEK